MESHHRIEKCVHGTLVRQCRCMGPKPTVFVACPTHCKFRTTAPRPMPTYPMVACLNGTHPPFNIEENPNGCPIHLAAELQHAHLDFCAGGAFCALDDCLCKCHVR